MTIDFLTKNMKTFQKYIENRDLTINSKDGLANLDGSQEEILSKLIGNIWENNRKEFINFLTKISSINTFVKEELDKLNKITPDNKTKNYDEITPSSADRQGEGGGTGE